MEQASRGQSKGAAHFKVRHRKKVARTDFSNWFDDLIFITGKWATPIKGEERHSRNYHKIMRYNGTRRQFAHFFGFNIWLSVPFCTFYSVEITTSLVSLKSDRCLKRREKCLITKNETKIGRDFFAHESEQSVINTRTLRVTSQLWRVGKLNL